MAASYFFASPLDVEIKLEGEELRKKVDIKLEKEKTGAYQAPYHFSDAAESY